MNDDYRGSTNSHIDTHVARAGTYLVVVREYWDAPGGFTLTLASLGHRECRQECGTSDRCPTTAAVCNPASSASARRARRTATRRPSRRRRARRHTRLCVSGSHYDGTPGVCACVPDAPTATRCGGIRGQTCAATEYCSFTDAAMCGYADQQGTCTARPQICPALFLQVCGCNGQTYGNYCYAQRAGTSVRCTRAPARTRLNPSDLNEARSIGRLGCLAHPGRWLLQCRDRAPMKRWRGTPSVMHDAVDRHRRSRRERRPRATDRPQRDARHRGDPAGARARAAWSTRSAVWARARRARHDQDR